MNICKSLISKSKQLKVLYVEDNEEARVQTTKMLKNYFSDITEAINGKEGLEKFKASSYHIVFTDLNMPIMDGISMIEAIRKFDNKTPIIVFSAYSDSEYLLETVNSGIDGYILKPYDFNQIHKVIEKIVSKYEIEIKLKNEILLEFDFVWNKDNKTISQGNEIFKLTKNEISLLDFFAKSENIIRSNDEIENYIFKDEVSDKKRVRNMISRLKTKLGVNLIESNYGSGYRLKVRN